MVGFCAGRQAASAVAGMSAPTENAHRGVAQRHATRHIFKECAASGAFRIFEKLSIAHRMLVKHEKLAGVAKEFRVSKSRVSVLTSQVKRKPDCL